MPEIANVGKLPFRQSFIVVLLSRLQAYIECSSPMESPLPTSNVSLAGSPPMGSCVFKPPGLSTLKGILKLHSTPSKIRHRKLCIQLKSLRLDARLETEWRLSWHRWEPTDEASPGNVILVKYLCCFLQNTLPLEFCCLNRLNFSLFRHDAHHFKRIPLHCQPMTRQALKRNCLGLGAHSGFTLANLRTAIGWTWSSLSLSLSFCSKF